MSVYAPMLGLFRRALEAKGIEPESLGGLLARRPDEPSLLEGRISQQAYLNLQEQVFGLLRSPSVGLDMAEKLHPSHLGPLGYAWLASSSLKTALLRLQRYTRMFNEDGVTEIVERKESLAVTYRVSAAHGYLDQLADLQIGCLMVMCRWNAGDGFRPAGVRLKRAPPADPGPWQRFFGVEVEFGANLNELVIDARAAGRKLTSSNPLLVSVHEDLIRKQLEKLHRSEFELQVQSAIIDQLPSGSVSEMSVAASLGLSRRTLHRRLRRRQTSFRPLLEEVRRRLSREYLDDTRYSVTEIAFLLGFSDTSAFSRAFRRWFGSSPSACRAGRSDSRLC